MEQLTLLDLVHDDKEDVKKVLKELSNTCNNCRLSLVHPDNRGIIWRGNPNGRVAVIGEAPGDKETEMGMPLVGNSGKEWERWASRINLDTKNDCFLTNVVQCFTGDSIPTAFGVTKMYRRFYSGLGFRITSSEGHVLTGTPNHPVLTDRGWVPLSKLLVGDYLINDNFVRNESAIRPNPHNEPASFDKIFSLLSGKYPLSRIVGGSSDFHGDGSDNEIDIISIDRELRLNINTTEPETINDLTFIPPDQLAMWTTLSELRSSLSSGSKGFSSLSLTPGSFMSSFSHSIPIAFRGGIVSNFIPLRNSSQSYASLQKLALYSLVVDSSFFRQFLKANSRQVFISQVVDIKEVKLSEHVYNLSTESNSYSVNNIIAHNCQPPKRKKDGKLQQRPPEKDELKACFGSRCLRLLRAMPNLEVVITLGWVAAQAVLGGEPKARTHEGMWFTTNVLPNVPVFCLVHPSYILRDPNPEKSGRVYYCLDAFKREFLDSNKIKDIMNDSKE